MKTDLYLDLEWFQTQEVFLIGYAYSLSDTGQLYDERLTLENIISLLTPVNGYIFFYGPDIGMLEKNTGLDIWNNFNCVNLLTLFRRIMPGLDSHKLSDLEELFNIDRSVKQYKTNIFNLMRDWYNPAKKQYVLRYNREDVLNLIRLKNEVFKSYNFDLEGYFG